MLLPGNDPASIQSAAQRLADAAAQSLASGQVVRL